jgi:hypothetical protein
MFQRYQVREYITASFADNFFLPLIENGLCICHSALTKWGKLSH